MEAGGTLKFAWNIKNFSNPQAQILYSDAFSIGPYKWWILTYPKGDKVDKYCSIYLEVADYATLPFGWSRNAKFSLAVVDQIDNESSLIRVLEREFNVNAKNWGFSSFISHEELCDPKKGYLVEDTCIIEANVTVLGVASVDSHGSSKLEAKKREIKENSNEEDMDAFFVDLNSVISPEKIVALEEEVKQAMVLIEESLNMVPADLNNPGRMSQLTNAFDVLYSLDDGSILASGQKKFFLSMKDYFVDLSERAARADKDKKLFTEKEYVKKTIDHKLGRCLIKFEKAKAETMQYKQDISILQEQIFEKKRKEDESTSMQKQMFKQSKELKAELDMLVKHWPIYEARMNAAEEEEKVIGKEWSEIKQLFSSLKIPSL